MGSTELSPVLKERSSILCLGGVRVFLFHPHTLLSPVHLPGKLPCDFSLSLGFLICNGATPTVCCKDRAAPWRVCSEGCNRLVQHACTPGHLLTHPRERDVGRTPRPQVGAETSALG